MWNYWNVQHFEDPAFICTQNVCVKYEHVQKVCHQIYFCKKGPMKTCNKSTHESPQEIQTTARYP